MSTSEHEGVEPGDVGDDADSLPDAASLGESPVERETGGDPEDADAPSG